MLPERHAAGFSQSIAQIETLLDDMMTRVKDLSLQLRPSTLDDLGVLPTLLRHFAIYKDQTSIGVLFKQRGLNRRLPSQLETAVFRIVQEGLTNVARHAGAATAEVRIVVTGTKVRIEVSDKGKGFLPDAVFSSGSASGIVGMMERATLLGGHLSVESIPGLGTRLLADIPLKAPPRKRGSR
jgi:signal transduction histidine kinase